MRMYEEMGKMEEDRTEKGEENEAKRGNQRVKRDAGKMSG